METDKLLIKRIPKILASQNDEQFLQELLSIMVQNIIYLILYAITMFIIETIGKIAIKNAINNITSQILEADLSFIQKKDYEHKITSVIHHAENLTAVVRNLFIELPRKIVASYHFLVVLKELSWKIMLYCIFANILFVLVTFLISFVRKKFISKIVEHNINFSLICSDLSNSIQTYKVDCRTVEYQTKINKITNKVCWYSSFDSLMVAITDVTSSFSSQFMLGFISYMCRPMLLDKNILLEDLMYGIRSSSRFIEKMISVVEYFSDVIRQYKSFNFFNECKKIIREKKDYMDGNIAKIIINNMEIIPNKIGSLIHVAGKNGIGKTTLLFKFLGVDYYGATTNGTMVAFDEFGNKLYPKSYKKNIAFVQQTIPVTYDTVWEYISATSKLSNFRINDVLKFYNINTTTSNYIVQFLDSLGKNKQIRELSGGQAKMVQIIAAICKLYANKNKILILDEPSNNLDIEKIEHVKEIFKSCIDTGAIIFMVTHDDRMLEIGHTTVELG